eukprot:m.130803 g.130803  ORF g.130803 m.130803 type:complete len:52 (-) comp14608_c0_seq9:125-280(-)
MPGMSACLTLLDQNIAIDNHCRWSESSYLEPDEREGMAKLEAVGAVFGTTI